MTPEEELALAVELCADEPIAVPGAIQPHGILLGCHDDDAQTVVRCTDNAADLLGLAPADVLGRELSELFDVPDRQALLEDLLDVNPWPTTVNGLECHVMFHHADGLLVVEVEPALGDDPPWNRRVRGALFRIQDSTSTVGVVETLTREVARLTGFDRVMAYAFDAQWNGEVIAEQRLEHLEAWLGLRYPASDIPAQARELYTRNWLRLIPTIDYRPAVLLGPPGAPADTLDLSMSVLRSVSPVHLAYLRNMGVAASMSVSLVVDDRLWGLVACHHYAGPHRPSLWVRAAVEFLARTASATLATVRSRERYDAALRDAGAIADLTLSLSHPSRSMHAALTEDPVTLRDLIRCGGAAVQLAGRITLVGETPPIEQVEALTEALWPDPVRATVALDALPHAHPELASLSDVASGVLAVPLAAGSDAGLLWFRPEVVREVTWGGDPHAPKLTQTPDGPALHPRSSFAAWSELVHQTSEPWAEHEVEAGARLASNVNDALLERRVRDDQVAETLQRLLLGEELPALPGLDLGVCYLPSARDVVGADWYDVVILPNGHFAVVVGDVAGHGLGMSTVTAQLRMALRAYLIRDLDPAAALSRLNSLASWLLPAELATVVVVDLDPVTRVARVANAGHPGPALVSRAGTRFVEADVHPALGVLDGVEYPVAQVQLQPGEVLLAFTDGLVERRGVDLDVRLAQLGEAIRDPGDDLDRLCEDLVSDMGAAGGDDDVTVLALRFEEQ